MVTVQSPQEPGGDEVTFMYPVGYYGFGIGYGNNFGDGLGIGYDNGDWLHPGDGCGCGYG